MENMTEDKILNLVEGNDLYVRIDNISRTHNRDSDRGRDKDGNMYIGSTTEGCSLEDIGRTSDLYNTNVLFDEW